MLKTLGSMLKSHRATQRQGRGTFPIPPGESERQPFLQAASWLVSVKGKGNLSFWGCDKLPNKEVLLTSVGGL